DGNAVQRPADAPVRGLGRERAGRRPRTVVVHVRPCRQPTIERVDAVETGLHEVEGRDLSIADAPGGLADAERGQRARVTGGHRAAHTRAAWASRSARTKRPTTSSMPSPVVSIVRWACR